MWVLEIKPGPPAGAASAPSHWAALQPGLPLHSLKRSGYRRVQQHPCGRKPWHQIYKHRNMQETCTHGAGHLAIEELHHWSCLSFPRTHSKGSDKMPLFWAEERGFPSSSSRLWEQTGQNWPGFSIHTELHEIFFFFMVHLGIAIWELNSLPFPRK